MELPVTAETANQLNTEYGYEISSTSNAKAYLVYPKAPLLLGTIRDDFKWYLELDDVLALRLIDADAWEAYLSKFDN